MSRLTAAITAFDADNTDVVCMCEVIVFYCPQLTYDQLKELKCDRTILDAFSY